MLVEQCALMHIFFLGTPVCALIGACAPMITKSLCMRKPTIWVSDHVQHKPGCTVTEAG